ncbi:MAG: glycogen/starch/alpha-glucan family phosphorylase, partial [Planctomycetota bacterium]
MKRAKPTAKAKTTTKRAAGAPERAAKAASRGTATDDLRTGTSPGAIARAVLDNLRYVQGRLPEIATPHDWYKAFAYTVRDRLVDRWMDTIRTIMQEHAKAVCYLSAEFLMGPHLGNGLLNLGMLDAAREAAAELDLDFDRILSEEEEPGLGNGGLGRLAACFMDSLATLGVPAIGFGIRYEFGIFDQAIRDGAQVEITDKWLSRGNPWEIERPEICFDVKLGGRTETYHDALGRLRVRWIPQRVVRGVAYDTPVPGFESKTVNLLRLWKAEACESFDFAAFNTGDYLGAVQEKVSSETISKVLYPNDELSAGKHLRLAQQYFFVSCSLQDVIRVHLARGRGLDDLADAWAVQLNDTHPSIAVAELMRLLVDEHQLDWDRAWSITQKTLSYTNHTLLPEALERWPVPLFGGQLPRHLEIVYEINRRFLDDVGKTHPGDDARAARLSLIDETGQKAVRMAHLACVGSHAINGVAALHTELLKKTVLRDFHEIWPEKFRNVTNGVTPRRWVALSNPRLTNLITGGLGGRWLRHTEEELPRLEPLADDAAFRRSWREVKLANKRDLAGFLRERTGV